MTYRDGFDRLGNQLPQPRPNWHHRLLWRVCVASIAINILLLWGPK